MHIQNENLQKRVYTGFFLAIAGCTMLGLSQYPGVTELCISILTVYGIYEFRKSIATSWSAWFYRAMLLIGIAICWISISCYEELTALSFCLSFLFSIYLIIKVSDDSAPTSLSDLQSVLLGLEIPLFFRALYEIRILEYGLYHITAALLVCASTDVAAYFIGSKWGKTKLAPLVSPYKTVEGALGGIAAALLILNLITWLLSISSTVPANFSAIWMYAITASAIGQVGDLFMSALKRIAGIKDFGAVLPGHGGILDRFDSLLYVLPYTYLFYKFAGPLVR